MGTEPGRRASDGGSEKDDVLGCRRGPSSRSETEKKQRDDLFRQLVHEGLFERAQTAKKRHSRGKRRRGRQLPCQERTQNGLVRSRILIKKIQGDAMQCAGEKKNV